MLTDIIAREVKVLLGNRGQRITTAVILIIILGMGVFARYFLSPSDLAQQALPQTSATVGVSAEMGEYAPLILQSTGLEVAYVPENEAPEKWLLGEEAQNSGVSTVLSGEPGAPQIVVFGTPDQGTIAELTRVSTLFTSAQLLGAPTPTQLEQLSSASQPSIHYVSDPNDTLSSNPLGYAMAMVTLMILFFAIVSGVTIVSQGVVEEKSSRIVEILLASVRPRKLLLGKVLGIGAFSLLQVALYLCAVVASAFIAGYLHELPLGRSIVWTIVWVVIGFFIYVSLTGAFAATVSRQEDLGSVSMMASFLMIIPFYLAMFLVPMQPESTLTTVLSMIPGFSSFKMPLRQVLSDVPIWQLVTSVGLGVITVPLLALLSGKIYENSVLRMGKRVSLREALGLAK